jgi:hypothetical protein
VILASCRFCPLVELQVHSHGLAVSIPSVGLVSLCFALLCFASWDCDICHTVSDQAHASLYSNSSFLQERVDYRKLREDSLQHTPSLGPILPVACRHYVASGTYVASGMSSSVGWFLICPPPTTSGSSCTAEAVLAPVQFYCGFSFPIPN